MLKQTVNHQQDDLYLNLMALADGVLYGLTL